MNGLLTRLTLKVNDMKKTFFTATCLLALVACAMVSACRKDDVETIKENPVPPTPQTPSQTWPAGALMSGDDTYDYGNHDSEHNIYMIRRDLDRVESMLCIFFHDNTDINALLPSGFSTVLPIDDTIWCLPNSKGVITVFSGMDRTTAINQIKGIDDVFAIEPVYNWQEKQVAATPYVHVMLNYTKDDGKALLELADSLHLTLCKQSSFLDKQVYEFIADHSLVNSVVAANIIYELLGTDYIYLSTYGSIVCDDIND